MTPIKDIELALEKALLHISQLDGIGRLPEGLKPLAVLLQLRPDHEIRCSIRSHAGGSKTRKKRCDARVERVSLEKHVLWISSLPRSSASRQAPDSIKRIKRESHPVQREAPLSLGPQEDAALLQQLLRHLHAAETTHPFVSWKWFRDKFLPLHSWPHSPRRTERMIHILIRQGLALEGMIENPILPGQRTRTIRVRRNEPQVA